MQKLTLWNALYTLLSEEDSWGDTGCIKGMGSGPGLGPFTTNDLKNNHGTFLSLSISSIFFICKLGIMIIKVPPLELP